MKLGPCICERHWDLPMAPKGLNLPLSQKLLRRLEVAGVQVPHEDDWVGMTVLHLTEGLGHEVDSLRNDVVALTAKRMCPGCNQRVAIGFSPQGCPVNGTAGREWNKVTGNVLPLVSPEQNVCIIELLGGSSCGKRPNVAGPLVEHIQDGTLLMPHLWNGGDLGLHAQKLVHDGMDTAGQCENIKVPGDEARRSTLGVLVLPIAGHLPGWSLSFRPSTRAAPQGAPSIGL
mmetsp:Transcript_140301/g.198866  ORF Transcript_140301/g.198866 Transcript_140301/m.198866 type:complete len:230 (+) Transcript_140301:266-955(+)